MKKSAIIGQVYHVYSPLNAPSEGKDSMEFYQNQSHFLPKKILVLYPLPGTQQGSSYPRQHNTKPSVSFLQSMDAGVLFISSPDNKHQHWHQNSSKNKFMDLSTLIKELLRINEVLIKRMLNDLVRRNKNTYKNKHFQDAFHQN